MAIYYSEDLRAWPAMPLNHAKMKAKMLTVFPIMPMRRFGHCQKMERPDYDSIFVAHYMPDGAIFIADAVKALIALAIDAMDTPELYEIAGKLRKAHAEVILTRSSPAGQKVLSKNFQKCYPTHSYAVRAMMPPGCHIEESGS